MEEEIVTAFPLPPDYWRELDVDAIRQMTPPPPTTESLLVFGQEQKPVDLDSLESTTKASLDRLKEGHRQVFATFKSLIEMAAAGDTATDYAAVQGELIEALSGMMEACNTLRLAQGVKDLNTINEL